MPHFFFSKFYISYLLLVAHIYRHFLLVLLYIVMIILFFNILVCEHNKNRIYKHIFIENCIKNKKKRTEIKKKNINFHLSSNRKQKKVYLFVCFFFHFLSMAQRLWWKLCKTEKGGMAFKKIAKQIWEIANGGWLERIFMCYIYALGALDY